VVAIIYFFFFSVIYWSESTDYTNLFKMSVTTHPSKICYALTVTPDILVHLALQGSVLQYFGKRITFPSERKLQPFFLTLRMLCRFGWSQSLIVSATTACEIFTLESDLVAQTSRLSTKTSVPRVGSL